MSTAQGRPDARGDGTSYGLAPRPQVDPVVVAVVAAAVDQAWPRPVVAVADPRAAGHPWRFSGRWWAQPMLVRRDRPSSARAR